MLQIENTKRTHVQYNDTKKQDEFKQRNISQEVRSANCLHVFEKVIRKKRNDGQPSV